MALSAFDIGAILLVLAAVIGLANDRWFGLPRNIALLLGALISAGVFMVVTHLRLDGVPAEYWRARMREANLSHVLLDGVLALLLFASALHVDPRELRDRAWSVAVLATLGVIVAALVFGWGLFALTLVVGMPIPLLWCLCLGIILAPTDAVVVEGLLRRVRMPPMLRGMINGESLFNDGAAVVLFLTVIAVSQGEEGLIGNGRLVMVITKEVVGGGVIGWLASLAVVRLSRGLEDRSVELTLTLALALGSYRLADSLGVSGPIAVVAAGLIWRQGSTHGRTGDDRVVTSWAVIDDLLNTWLFLLIGFQVLTIRAGWEAILLLPFVFLLATFARAVSVTPPVLLTRMAGHDKPRGIAVLTWTGLRGGISVALALTLPESPYREALTTIAYAVVLMSILIQGLSVPWLMRALYPPDRR